MSDFSFQLERNNAIYEEIIKSCNTKFQKTYWKWFVLLSETPRPSYHCEKVACWVEEVAKKLGLESKKDKSNNVCVHIPPTEGIQSEGVILQAHLDMVASVRDGKKFDFENTPITLKIKDGFIYADDTTLGADDGAGVSCLLSLMELRNEFKHGPIEALFTTDEEPGLLGALELKEGELFKTAKYMINVDSEQWGECTISSAGCAQRNITIPFKRSKCHGDLVTMKIQGLTGGHTGEEINQQRANALKWLVEMLMHRNLSAHPFQIVEFQAGHTDNAIPTKGYMKLLVKDGEDMKAMLEKIHKCYAEVFEATDSGIQYTIEVEKNVDAEAGSVVDSMNAMLLLKAIPHGVVRFSNEVPGLVETSTSLSIATIKDDFVITTLSRSADNEYLADITKTIEILVGLFNAKITIPTPDIGGWPAKPDCHLVDVIKKVYHDLYKTDMKITACHGGLENSIILNQYPSMDLESISIGPTCSNVHTADEHIEIESGNKLLDLVCALVTGLI